MWASSKFIVFQTVLRLYVSCFAIIWEKLDPEVYETAPEIIEDKGYRANEYIIETEDGYQLTLHRLRSKLSALLIGRFRKVVLLQHGLLDSCHTWINNLSNQSLGFILADAGYDVWLGNSRGNTYSQRHAYLDPAKDEFWRFSWDEMVEYDLPRVVDFIIQETRVSKIFYVGHSQGSQIMLARLNKDPRMRGQVAAVAALAPVAYLGNVISPIHHLAPFCLSLTVAKHFFQSSARFLPSNLLIRFLSGFLCERQGLPFICENLMFLLAGYDKQNMNMTRLPVYVSHAPAGTSVQNIVHYCQGMWHGRFEAFDFGTAGNLAKYNRTTPPPYGLASVGVPVTVYWGGRDRLSTPPDVRRILRELARGAAAEVRDIYVDNYNHLDFVWGVDAVFRVYNDIILFFQRYL